MHKHKLCQLAILTLTQKDPKIGQYLCFKKFHSNTEDRSLKERLFMKEMTSHLIFVSFAKRDTDL